MWCSIPKMEKGKMLVHEPTKSIVLRLRNPDRVLVTLPKLSRLVDTPAGNVQVRHTFDTTIVLNNMGFDVPSPMEYQYDWPGRYKPFDHQRPMADFHVRNPKGLDLSEMGVGKTFPTLWAADYLMSIGEVKKALVLSPLSTIEDVWQKDIFKILMHRSSVITHGDREHRLRSFGLDVDFYIANHDMIRDKEVATLVRKRKDIDLIILDEASFFRNPKTLMYQYFAWATAFKNRVWLMTGTPCPNAPTDAWGLARLVCPDRVPRFFGAFQRKTMYQVSQFKWKPLKNHEQIVYDALQPAMRYRKQDCLSLPPVTITDYKTTLTPEQEKAFNLMRDYMIMQHQTTKITAVNAADTLGKLRQICCGAIKDPTTEDYTTLDHSTRFNDLVYIAKQASAKVIVIVPFKGIIRVLEQELKPHFSVGVLNGDVSNKERTRIITAFKSGPDPHMLLCHPKVMAHGLNLTEADTTIFYAPIYSHDEYAQVIERFNRAGQTRKMTVVRIYAHFLERELYANLDNKANTQASILKLYEQVIT